MDTFLWHTPGFKRFYHGITKHWRTTYKEGWILILTCQYTVDHFSPYSTRRYPVPNKAVHDTMPNSEHRMKIWILLFKCKKLVGKDDIALFRATV